MKKISMFGISGSGKTCYLYAMAQILRAGVSQGDFRLDIIANDSQQQADLDSGFMEMVNNGSWPGGTSSSTDYDLCVRVCDNKVLKEIIPNLILSDYAGGTWTNNDAQSKKDREALMDSFSDSFAVVFLVDGVTILRAMPTADRAEIHKDMASNPEVLAAKQQILFVENLFRDYKKARQKYIDNQPKTKDANNQANQIRLVPPVIVVVTKSDVFADADELKKGKELVKRCIPSVFALGSGVEAAITDVALGDNLGFVMEGNEKKITGNLILGPEKNIHLPIVYAFCAFLDDCCIGNHSPEDQQRECMHYASYLGAMMKGKVELFKNGNHLIAL